MLFSQLLSLCMAGPARALSKMYMSLVQGFELNPDQWLPLKQLQDCKAMEDWAHKRAVDGQWHASSHAEWSHQSAQADRRTDGKCKKK